MNWTLTPSPPQAPQSADPNLRTSSWYVSVPPVGRVVSAANVRQSQRIDVDQVDPGGQGDYLNLLIDAATDYAQDKIGAALMPQTITATYYDQASSIDLPRGPAIAVASVVDANGGAVAFRLVNFGNKVTRVITGLGGVLPLTIVYRAGHVAPDGVTAAVPPAIRLAILAHVGTLYENRESVADAKLAPVPHQLEAFYALHRRTLGLR